MIRKNLENEGNALFTRVIVLHYAGVLLEHSHDHEAYLFLDECERICDSSTDIGLLVDIKTTKMYLLIREDKWARAEKEALCILEMIQDKGISVYKEYNVRKDLARAYEKMQKYREAQEQRAIADCLLDID